MTESSNHESKLKTLLELSRMYGSDPHFVLAGGGNTSLKIGDRLFVKGSGVSLAEIGADGFVEMHRGLLDELLDSDLGDDPTIREERFAKAIMAARVYPQKGQRPSVEVVLHNLMPGNYVVHTHPAAINAIACCIDGEKVARELFGDDILWLDYVDPGFTLAKSLQFALEDYRKRTGRKFPEAAIMQNHGLFLAGNSTDEVRARTDRVLDLVHKRLDVAKSEEPFGATNRIDPAQSLLLLRRLGPVLRMLLAEKGMPRVVRFRDDEDVLVLAAGAEGKKAAAEGPLTPDQIVYCKSFPLWFKPEAEESETETVRRLRIAIDDHCRATDFPPKVVVAEGMGIFGIGGDFKTADTASAVYADAIKVMAGSRALGGTRYMTRRDREFIDSWEVESYRRKVAQSTGVGRVAGKIAFVTGAAQGFGLEIARGLAREGAHVILGDINGGGAEQAAEAICRDTGKGRSLGLQMDVTRSESIQAALDKVVREYGGIDLFVSNAGVLRAESVKTQSEEDFEFVTSVNYKGFFLCVQKGSPILALQHRADPQYRSDIVQINSKSGLVGSNRNGAYAGSKFGAIGLTQSFALELIEDGIKVNAICPGNFFDGPLWSDPQQGLFVQYLQSGKVPGAKTVEDVRKAYEAKVPMGRGCRTEDVLCAIFYLVEQQYETGQALPVTGGQVMLK